MNPHLALLFAAALAAPVLSAQDPAGGEAPAFDARVMPRLATPIHSAADDEGRAYGTWAAGEHYKASFHDGMTFVPSLGREYPTTRTWHWHTASVRLGETELLDGTPPRTALSDWRCEYRFGKVTEAYDVLLDGLEQTFVLHERAAAGDLVIRGEVTANLRAADVGAACQALEFRDEHGRAIVGYGRAVAVDADGRRCPVTTEHRGGAIQLTVPGDWLATAALPVVVDPIIAYSLFFLPFNSTPVFDIDIGRDDVAGTDNVMVTYSKGVSATDADLWVLLTDDDFGSWSQVFTDITASWSTSQARCAFVGGTSRWLLAFQRYFPGVPTVSRVRVHDHASGDTSLQTAVVGLGAGNNENHWRPDVGGVESFAAGDEALVVFQIENNGGGDFANAGASRIGGVLFDTLSGTFGTTFLIASSTLLDQEMPRVNQVAEGGAAFAWMCAYQRFVNALPNDAWDVAVLRIEQDGQVAPGFWASDLATGAPPTHQMGPVVEGAAGRYAVTFSTADAVGYPGKLGDGKGDAIVLERFDWYAGTAPTTAQPPVVVRTALTRSLEATGLGFNTVTRSHWVAASRFDLGTSGNLYYDKIGFQGQVTESGNIYSGGGSFAGGSLVYDNDTNVFLTADGSANGSFSIYGRRISKAGTSPPSTQGTTACGAAVLQWSGSQQIGEEFSGLQASGAPAGALHLLLLGDTSISVPLVVPGLVGPGCNLYVPFTGAGSLGVFPPQVGSTVDWQLPLPESLFAMTLQFQDWYLDPADSLLRNSARLQVPIAR